MKKSIVVRLKTELTEFLDENKIIPSEGYSNVIERLLVIQGYKVKILKRRRR